jgi:hypothetical protein
MMLLTSALNRTSKDLVFLFVVIIPPHHYRYSINSSCDGQAL